MLKGSINKLTDFKPTIAGHHQQPDLNLSQVQQGCKRLLPQAATVSSEMVAIKLESWVARKAIWYQVEGKYQQTDFKPIIAGHHQLPSDRAASNRVEKHCRALLAC